MKRSYRYLPIIPVVAALGACCSSQAESPAPPVPAAPAAMHAPSGLAVGATAPDFALKDQNGKVQRLSAYKGKPVVLAFYPADMTPGCTAEAHSLTKNAPAIAKHGVQLFGISVQNVVSKKQFCTKEGITYPLLADETKSVTKAYGVLSPRGVAERVTYIVAPDGKIAKAIHDVKMMTHGQDLLAMLDNPRKMVTAMKVAINKPVDSFTLPDADGKAQKVGD